MKPPAKLSVALCTHNGSSFLDHQLDSIRKQARQPDEIIVGDDASADRTIEILHRFAADSHFPVRVERNPIRLCSTANFSRVIARCTGDIIVLADQDDVWLSNKLEAIERTFQDDAEVGFAFSDAELVDEQLVPLGYSLWESLRFTRREQKRFGSGHAFAGLLRRYRATGATMAFRAAYRDLILPIPPEWVHDAWIALLISAVAPVGLIDEPLIRYRQHRSQQHGARIRGWCSEYRSARCITRERCEVVVARYAAAYERLASVPGVSLSALDLLAAKVEHHRRRAELRGHGVSRLPQVIREAWSGNYRRFALGWKTAAQDLFLGR